MDQWMFTAQELQYLPSIANGEMSASEERRKRTQGCTFIHHLGCRLDVPQLTVATAMVFFHRFYTRHSFGVYRELEIIAATCMYLACKVEESSRKVSDVVGYSLIHLHHRDKYNDDKQLFMLWRDKILRYELVLLEALCFDLSVEHPYPSLLVFLEELRVSERIYHAAWGFANDSLRTPLCLIYEPQIIAAACVLLGYRSCRQEIPNHRGSVLAQIMDDRSNVLGEVIKEIMRSYGPRDLPDRRNHRQNDSTSTSNRNRAPVPSSNGYRHQRVNGHPVARVVESRERSANNLGSSALSS
ncbi:cyclin-like protein [Dichotomocladium elegans]|nr:cyclin-like protein [Dichotomocladium elegans]